MSRYYIKGSGIKMRIIEKSAWVSDGIMSIVQLIKINRNLDQVLKIQLCIVWNIKR